MKCLIRADASSEMGTGHIMRCLTLALKLRQYGARVDFICRPHSDNLIQYIRDQGFHVYSLVNRYHKQHLQAYEKWLGTTVEQDAKQCLQLIKNNHYHWIIVDHYAINKSWHSLLRPQCKKIMVIDDISQQQHDCDLLLDQNYNFDSHRYDKLLPQQAVQLLGPQFALLRDEFGRQNLSVKSIDEVNNIFIYFGGADVNNLCGLSLQALASDEFSAIEINIVLGSQHPFQQEITHIVDQFSNMKLHQQVSDIHLLMQQAQLSIGAGGTTTWERLATGLPTLVISVADNQVAFSKQLAQDAYTDYLGHADEVTSDDIIKAVRLSIQNPRKLNEQSVKGRQLVNPEGTLEVIRTLYQNTPLEISILTDLNSWITPWVERFIKKMEDSGHQLKLVNESTELTQGDCCFLLSCSEIVSEAVLSLHTNNLVVHASALPEGKGMSPLSWQILDHKNDIPVTLFEAQPQLDSGDIYLQQTLHYDGHELLPELQQKLAECIIKLCSVFINQYPFVLKQAKKQQGGESFYKKRTPEDSRLDPQLAIADQFTLLRIVDNERYPAFFELQGHRYVLKIEKASI